MYDFEKIKAYVSEKTFFTLPELQKEFLIDYPSAAKAVATLVEMGNAEYTEGLFYRYIPLRRNRTDDAISKAQRELESLRKSLSRFHKDDETRKRNLFDWDDDDDDDNDDGEKDEDDDGEKPEFLYEDDEDFIKALKLCVETGACSAYEIRVKCGVPIYKAFTLLNRMETCGYVSAPNSHTGRKILIDATAFNALYGEKAGFINAEKPGETVENWFEERKREQKEAAQKLAVIAAKIAELKKQPVSKDVLPPHTLWANEQEFNDAVEERLKNLIRSDKNMGRTGAIKKAENYLEAVNDTHDGKMAQVYMRLVYELKNTSDYMYNSVRKKLFPPD